MYVTNTHAAYSLDVFLYAVIQTYKCELLDLIRNNISAQLDKWTPSKYKSINIIYHLISGNGGSNAQVFVSESFSSVRSFRRRNVRQCRGSCVKLSELEHDKPLKLESCQVRQ